MLTMEMRGNDSLHTYFLCMEMINCEVILILVLLLVLMGLEVGENIGALYYYYHAICLNLVLSRHVGVSGRLRTS